MRKSRNRVLLAAGVCAAAAVSATAYGATLSASKATYSGPELKFPHTYAKPSGKAKSAFTVGLLSPNASVLVLKQIIDGATAVVKAHGGTLTAEDAGFNVQTQVSQFQNLLAQHVNAIILFALDPAALAPSLAQAKAAGIPVISTDQPVDSTQKVDSHLTSDLALGRDKTAFLDAKTIAQKKPHASFAVIGTAAPVADLKYLTAREIYWGKRFGLKFVGEVDAQTDNAAGASAAMSGILARYHGVQALMTYNDATAESAAATALSSGNSTIKIASVNGEAPAIAEVKSGRLLSTVLINGTLAGTLEGYAAVDAVLKQHVPLPRLTVMSVTLITKANASKF